MHACNMGLFWSARVILSLPLKQTVESRDAEVNGCGGGGAMFSLFAFPMASLFLKGKYRTEFHFFFFLATIPLKPSPDC